MLIPSVSQDGDAVKATAAAASAAQDLPTLSNGKNPKLCLVTAVPLAAAGSDEGVAIKLGGDGTEGEAPIPTATVTVDTVIPAGQSIILKTSGYTRAAQIKLTGSGDHEVWYVPLGEG